MSDLVHADPGVRDTLTVSSIYTASTEANITRVSQTKFFGFCRDESSIMGMANGGLCDSSWLFARCLPYDIGSGRRSVAISE